MSSPHKIIVVVRVWCDQRSENTWQSTSVAPNKFYDVCLRVCIWTKCKTWNINMQEQEKRRRFIRTGMFIDRKNVTSLKKGNSGKSVYPKLIKKRHERTYLLYTGQRKAAYFRIYFHNCYFNLTAHWKSKLYFNFCLWPLHLVKLSTCGRKTTKSLDLSISCQFDCLSDKVKLHTVDSIPCRCCPCPICRRFGVSITEMFSFHWFSTFSNFILLVFTQKT